MTQLENLNIEEKELIIQFRKRMENVLTPGMDHDDLVFYRFLKARGFDIAKAESMLRKHIIYRKVMQIDTILEDFTPFEAFEYNHGTYIGEDKEGNPVRYFPIGRMDIRDVLKCFKMNNYIKHWIWSVEYDIAHLKEVNEKTGRNRWKISFIFDLNELQLPNVIHPSTAKYLLTLAEMYQDNYPETLRTVFIINAPAYYVLAFSIVKRILVADVIRKFKIFGKSGWQEELLNAIDADILPAYLGGNRRDPDGNPKCETFVNYAGRIPSKLYLSEEDRSFGDKSRVKTISVSAQTRYEVFVEVNEPGSLIQWEYRVEKKDIGFGLYFKKSDQDLTEILPVYRFETCDGTEKDSYKCLSSGKYVIIFDNTYSRMQAKEVSYCISVVKPQH